MTYRATILATALLSGIFATFSFTAQAADPVKIRVGWIVMPSNLAPILFAKAGIGRHNDKSYVLDPVYFSSSSAEITALATEQIDIAAMGFSTLPLAMKMPVSRTSGCSPTRFRMATAADLPCSSWFAGIPTSIR
jgi:ABC-type nitrate/sulfonate/bicarbonate transport system substrate-binding protein